MIMRPPTHREFKSLLARGLIQMQTPLLLKSNIITYNLQVVPYSAQTPTCSHSAHTSIIASTASTTYAFSSDSFAPVPSSNTRESFLAHTGHTYGGWRKSSPRLPCPASHRRGTRSDECQSNDPARETLCGLGGRATARASPLGSSWRR